MTRGLNNVCIIYLSYVIFLRHTVSAPVEGGTAFTVRTESLGSLPSFPFTPPPSQSLCHPSDHRWGQQCLSLFSYRTSLGGTVCAGESTLPSTATPLFGRQREGERGGEGRGRGGGGAGGGGGRGGGGGGGGGGGVGGEGGGGGGATQGHVSNRSRAPRCGAAPERSVGVMVYLDTRRIRQRDTG